MSIVRIRDYSDFVDSQAELSMLKAMWIVGERREGLVSRIKQLERLIDLWLNEQLGV